MPSSRTLHLLDAALAIWVAAWIALGVAIGVNVGHLTALSDTVAQDGRAVETVGRSLHSLGSLPLIGGEISKDAEQVQTGGRQHRQQRPAQRLVHPHAKRPARDRGRAPAVRAGIRFLPAGAPRAPP